jgi:predicted Zn-dependent protease
MKRLAFLTWASLALPLAVAIAQQSPSPQTTRYPPTSCEDSPEICRHRQLRRIPAPPVLPGGTLWAGRLLNEYIDRIGQKLARSAGSSQVFTFYVLYSSEINAQTFPGGRIVVNTGVIRVAQSEAELALVLAHEIAHPNLSRERGSFWNNPLLDLLTVTPLILCAGPVGMALSAGTGLTRRVTKARYSRSVEREADRLALECLVHAGYEPRASVKLFDHLEVERAGKGSKVEGIFSSHPLVSERKERLKQWAALFPLRDGLIENTLEFEEVRNEIINYDAAYARVLGLPPDEPSGPPELVHRYVDNP